MLLKYLFLVVLPFHAAAQEKINLAPVPRNQTQVDIHRSYSLVKRAGVIYKRFTTDAGELFVIDSQPLRKQTIEAGKCSRFKARRGGSKERRDIETLRADIPLPDSDWQAFGGLIQATVEDKCSETQVALEQAPVLELGVSKTITGMSGRIKSLTRTCSPI